MGGAGWARGEARVADDSDFETLKTLLAKEDGWNVEYEKDGVKVWSEDAAHGALRTVKVCFHRFNLFEKCLLNFLCHFFLYRFCQLLYPTRRRFSGFTLHIPRQPVDCNSIQEILFYFCFG